MNKIYIYALIDPKSDEIRYIGYTKNLGRRLSGHLTDKSSTHKTNWIKSLIKKKQRPLIEIIDEVSESEKNFWEQHYISLYKSWGVRLTNSTEGGDGGGRLGKKSKKSSLKKRRRTLKLKKKIPGYIAPSYRKKTRQEQLLTLTSESVRRKAVETRRKNYSEWHSIETKKKISIGNKGKFVSEETRRKQSQKRKGVSSPRTEETNQKFFKPVKQYNLNKEYIKTFPSLKEVRKHLGGYPNLWKALTNPFIYSAKGFYWTYDVKK